MDQVNQIIPSEFNIIQTGKGYTMKGWDFTLIEIAEALQNNRMLNPAYELGTNACPFNCNFCFTEKKQNPYNLKRPLKNELSMAERLKLINDSAELGARSIDFVGAGEPLIDPYFWELIGYMAGKGITPIVYTEGTAGGRGRNTLTSRDNAERLFDLGATIVLKVNSLEKEDYQNRVVLGDKEHQRQLGINYFEQRNRVLEVLMNVGFNKPDPTRLAFDTIICTENYDEITRIHRFARSNNIFVLFVNYLPSGRSSDPLTNAVSKEQQFAIFDELANIDKDEYGLIHKSAYPYAGGVPCSIRGLGLYVKIQGEAWDCPGESQPLGTIRQESLRELWEKAAPIRRRFNGGCEPREIFWRQHENSTQRSLPIIK